MKYKQNRKLSKVICDNCGVEFEKPTSEYKRNLSLNRKNFCTRSCTGKSNYNNFGERLNRVPPRARITNPFRYYLKTARARFKEIDLTLKDLEDQWIRQNGVCPYSGINLILNTHRKSNGKIYSASLDRIDSSIGYTKDNIQYVSQCINLMKNDMSHEDTLKVCKMISENYR